MASVNKAILIGNLGQDPEVRYLPNGDAVANVSLATNERWKDKNGEPQERAEWHRVVVYGKLAEVVAEYLKKGSSAYFEGRIQTRKWTDKEGQERYTTEIVADRMQMLGSKPSSDSKPGTSAQDYLKASGGSGKRTPAAEQKAIQGRGQSGFDDLEHDTPF